jgi:hypothetical protein
MQAATAIYREIELLQAPSVSPEPGLGERRRAYIGQGGIAAMLQRATRECSSDYVFPRSCERGSILLPDLQLCCLNVSTAGY